MSVDIAWDTIASGPDGEVLGEKIRAFVHAKFQQITLPRFINSVHVHSFELGSICPQVEIKDISDPLPDFYEDDEASDSELEDETPTRDEQGNFRSIAQQNSAAAIEHWNRSLRTADTMSPIHESQVRDPVGSRGRLQLKIEKPASIEIHSFPRSGTPGIPGGTSNLGYFPLPVGVLSGAQTPLAAVASGTTFSTGQWSHDLQYSRHTSTSEDTSTLAEDRPRTSDSIPSPEIGSPFDPSSPESRPVSLAAAEKVSDDLTLENESMSASSATKKALNNPLDLQVIAHVKYNGDIRMTLTAQILLDYPMPSFVNIPLKLSVTGMKFDGVAILALIKKRMHFAFLDPEDAQALCGESDYNKDEAPMHGGSNGNSAFGTLLREVQIESEIGQQTSGKQVLKNVGKVEKFVLEQVKKIFEEEFVFPSFWTFLV